ncbi:unnamed protein product [Cylindrotheca closterium]|uniref:Uncharacterized protein n=1 Tax=Cylindrotheca closterium TaxID=2856 RepID=A0AAD2G782_9STRA|nr:unnamed protein product [Cylindrotheca closterium]
MLLLEPKSIKNSHAPSALYIYKAQQQCQQTNELEEEVPKDDNEHPIVWDKKTAATAKEKKSRHHQQIQLTMQQSPTVVFDLATAQRVITTDEKSPRFWEFSLMFNPTLIVQRAKPLTWMWLAASEFFAHPWTGPAIIPPIVEEFEQLEQESKIAKAQSKSKKRPASTPENPKGAKAHDSRPSPSVPMQTELTPPKGPSKPYQRTPPSDATPPCQQVVMSDAVHVIAGTPTETQEASVPADDVVVANTPRGRTSAENGAEEHNSAPTYRDTVATLPAPTVPLTTDERLMRLLAVHWNASPFRHITIFNVSIVFDWQGVGSSEFNQVQTAYNAFHQFASGIWGEITSKVVLLPLLMADSPNNNCGSGT